MRLQLAVDSEAKLTLLIVLIVVFIVWISSQADSKTKVWVLYLGGDPQEYGEGVRPVKGALMSRLLLWAAGSQSWATPTERLEHKLQLVSLRASSCPSLVEIAPGHITSALPACPPLPCEQRKPWGRGTQVSVFEMGRLSTPAVGDLQGGKGTNSFCYICFWSQHLVLIRMHLDWWPELEGWHLVGAKQGSNQGSEAGISPKGGRNWGIGGRQTQALVPFLPLIKCVLASHLIARSLSLLIYKVDTTALQGW